MSKKFMDNAFRILKSAYYMEKLEKITEEIKKDFGVIKQYWEELKENKL